MNVLNIFNTLIDFNYKLNVFNDITVIEIEKAIKHMLNVME